MAEDTLLLHSFLLSFSFSRLSPHNLPSPSFFYLFSSSHSFPSIHITLTPILLSLSLSQSIQIPFALIPLPPRTISLPFPLLSTDLDHPYTLPLLPPHSFFFLLRLSGVHSFELHTLSPFLHLILTHPHTHTHTHTLTESPNLLFSSLHTFPSFTHSLHIRNNTLTAITD
ncbi:MAG: hypothetical protein JOS17DRAFT_336218 [Linnemannia elongata]|nr:MAG: hypothetical protein JOS17DRAFT_336218 [Linnemannia elongata]